VRTPERLATSPIINIPIRLHPLTSSALEGVPWASWRAMAADDSAQPQGGASVSERNKAVVRRLVDEVLNGGWLGVVDELYAPALAPGAKAWITPFRASFPDVHMQVIELIAEGDTVVGRFTCSGTHLGDWLGYAPTGRRFEAVDEVGIYHVRDGRIVETWGLEDNVGRLEQLGLR
jgi:hypothetical protein